MSWDDRPVSNVPLGFPPALETFVSLFNQAKFWDSHEALEGPWRVSRSEFYHGLILYASALVHVQGGNAHGVAAQFAKAELALQRYRPAYLGVDVDAIVTHARAGRQAVKHLPEDVDQLTTIIGFPTMQLEPRFRKGTETELSD